MREFLFGLAEVTLTMSAVIAGLFLLGRVLEKRFAPQWRYWAWLAVALRLCVPFNISLPQAPVRVEVPRAVVRVEQPLPAGNGGAAVHWNAGPQADGPEQIGQKYQLQPPVGSGGAPETAEAGRIPVETLLFALWAAGAAAFLGVQGITYFNFKRRVLRWSRAAGSYRGVPVVRCDVVASPVLMGLVRPTIVLPGGGASEFAMLHEYTHARRRDLWYKLLLVLANGVHWFNPLVWALRRAAERDVEIACDADVLRGRDQAERRAYGQALLDTVRPGRGRGSALTSAFSGSKKSLKQRFRSLMDMAPRHPGRAALALVCALALLGGTLVACVPRESEPVPVDTPAIPAGDFYDQDSGLYVSAYVKAGVVVPAELRDSIMPRHREKSQGDPVVEFLDKDGADGTVLFSMETFGTTYDTAAGGDSWGPAFSDSWFPADHAQLAVAGENTDPVTGSTFTLPEGAQGLILISSQSGTWSVGGNASPRFIPDGSAWLLCVHPEMLAGIGVENFVAGRAGVFCLALPTAFEPTWYFGWEGRYPYLNAELSEEALAACQAVLDAQADIQASLTLDPDRQAAAKLGTQSGVASVELLKTLPAQQGYIDYANEEFGFTVTLPQAAAEHLAAVTVHRGSAGDRPAGDFGASPSPGATAQEIEELQRTLQAAQEAVDAADSVVFVDLRVSALTEALVDFPMWAGRLVCAGPGERVQHLDLVGANDAYRFYAAPTLLNEDTVQGVGQVDGAGILETAAAVAQALGQLQTGAEGGTLLERFVPDTLTAHYLGPDEGETGPEDPRWYELRLDFHFWDKAELDQVLDYQLEFGLDSPMMELMGVTPFRADSMIHEGGGGGHATFHTGRNTVDEAYMAALVARGGDCTLKVTDLRTGRERTFPMTVQWGGESETLYAQGLQYEDGQLTFAPLELDQRLNSGAVARTGPQRTLPLAEGAAMRAGRKEFDSVQDFLAWQYLSSQAINAAELTVVAGSVVSMEWVWAPLTGVPSPETRPGVVHMVDAAGGRISGFWLDESGVMDPDDAFDLAVGEGANVQLLDSEGWYTGPVGLEGLERAVAPLSSWGLDCDISVLDGQVVGVVQRGS